jgi:hypothetical protein
MIIGDKGLLLDGKTLIGEIGRDPRGLVVDVFDEGRDDKGRDCVPRGANKVDES